MSLLSEDNGILKQKNVKRGGWFDHQRNLIRLVENYPITYHPTPEHPSKNYYSKLYDAWKEIALKLGQPYKSFKRPWKNIKLKYAKLMILKNARIISEKDVIKHSEIRKFFDGSLSFLDLHISKITDKDIPYPIHKFINNIIGLKTDRSNPNNYTTFVTHAKVKALLRVRQSKQDNDSEKIDTKYLQIVINSAIKRKLEELKVMKNVLTTPSNNIENKDCEETANVTMTPSKNITHDEENISEQSNLGLESELIIEDDMKIEHEDDVIEENLNLNNNITNAIVENYPLENLNVRNNISNTIVESYPLENLNLSDNIGNAIVESYPLENILPNDKIVMPVVHEIMNNTPTGLNDNVMDIANNTDHITSDDYVRSFFTELGDVLSIELSTSKQKILKSRINELLVKSIMYESQFLVFGPQVNSQ